MRRIAYELSELAAGGIHNMSDDIVKMALDFIEQAQKSASSLASKEEDPEDYLEYFEDFLDGTPSLHQMKSDKLVNMLLDNPALGAIPLKDLRAADLIRGDKIDVYDYLQAAVEAAVSVTANRIVKQELDKEALLKTKKTGPVVQPQPFEFPEEGEDKKETEEPETLDRDKETRMDLPLSKRPQEASVRIGNSVYRRISA